MVIVNEPLFAVCGYLGKFFAIFTTLEEAEALRVSIDDDTWIAIWEPHWSNQMAWVDTTMQKSRTLKRLGKKVERK